MYPAKNKAPMITQPPNSSDLTEVEFLQFPKLKVNLKKKSQCESAHVV